jgi:hypothetical protein
MEKWQACGSLFCNHVILNRSHKNLPQALRALLQNNPGSSSFTWKDLRCQGV